MQEFSRSERIGAEMARELAYLLRDAAKDRRLAEVTIQEVRVTRDLSHAKVYFTVLDRDHAKQMGKILAHAAGFLRRRRCRISYSLLHGSPSRGRRCAAPSDGVHNLLQPLFYGVLRQHECPRGLGAVRPPSLMRHAAPHQAYKLPLSSIEVDVLSDTRQTGVGAFNRLVRSPADNTGTSRHCVQHGLKLQRRQVRKENDLGGIHDSVPDTRIGKGAAAHCPSVQPGRPVVTPRRDVKTSCGE